MKRMSRASLAAILVAWVAVACVPKIKEPDVRLAGVRVGGLGLDGGLIYVRLSVVNPNDFGIEAAGLTYDLDLKRAADGEASWDDVAEGTYRETVRVGSNDSAVVEIPVEFRYSGLGGAVQSLLSSGSVSYRVRGSVAITKPVRTEIPYRHTGTVSLFQGR